MQSTEKLASYLCVRKQLDGAAMPADVAIIGDAQVLAAGIEAFAEVGVSDLAVAIPTNGGAAGGETRQVFSELSGCWSNSLFFLGLCRYDLSRRL